MYTPPLGFHFSVDVVGVSQRADDLRFTEVGGLAYELATEDVPEGGENRYVQKYPQRAKYADLTLKRGLLVGSELRDWVRRCTAELQIEPKDVNVTLLDDAHEPLMTWRLVKAWPVKWSVSDLNATGNSFVVESMQLAYQTFSIDSA